MDTISKENLLALLLLKRKQKHNLEKTKKLNKQKIWQWIKIIPFYCLNKTWCKLDMRWTKNTKVTTCIDALPIP